MKDEDGIDLPLGDFRRTRRYLAPWLFALPGGEEGKTYPPPWDLIAEERWDSVMTLPTDVALKATSYEGTRVAALSHLNSDWIFSWPNAGEAPFMEQPSLVASEEFDALVFNATHGYYRQAIGCLRNAIETLMVAAGLAVVNNAGLFTSWWEQGQQIGFGQARAWLRDSTEGQQIDASALPGSIFGDADSSWTKETYARLCGYAHSTAGYNNADFWESNGPIFVPRALEVVEVEMRNALALGYLLLRIGWPGWRAGQGPISLIEGPLGAWGRYEVTVLRPWWGL